MRWNDSYTLPFLLSGSSPIEAWKIWTESGRVVGCGLYDVFEILQNIGLGEMRYPASHCTGGQLHRVVVLPDSPIHDFEVHGNSNSL